MLDFNIFQNWFDTMITFLATHSNMILPALATFSVVALIIGKLYYRLRIKFPVKVNCWFCNTNTSVPYNSGNSWYCPSCEQYNGFCSDGSYNRFLPEQSNEKLNFGLWCSRSKQKMEKTSMNGLCRFCNINLELKVQQLAQFVPLNYANYDEEIEQYSAQLERVYRLCSQCQRYLENTLNKKQELYLTNQQQAFKTSFNYLNSQPKEKERHSLYLGLTAALSLCLLLSTIPHSWLNQLIAAHPPPDYISQLIRLVPTAVPPSVLPLMGVVVQVFDCLHMKDVTSLVNLCVWVILLALPHVPVQVEGLVSIVQMLASIVFFITSVAESKRIKPRTVAAVKPVQFHKLQEKAATQKSTKLPDTESSNKPLPSNPTVSDTTPTLPDPSSPHEPTTMDDFGFSKLNVSSRRVTRSQTKPFQAKQYASTGHHEIFRPKPVHLTPPKLQPDKISEYQVPLTRSSSQSSGFVSLSHQKDFDEDRSPSIVNDNIDSISQCGGAALTPYRSPFSSPAPFFHQYGGPFSQFQPYAIVHFTPPPYDKFYPCSNMSFYEPSLNVSSSTIAPQRGFHNVGWFQYVKNALSSLVFLFLITSNVAILWKVFGEEYFNLKTRA